MLNQQEERPLSIGSAVQFTHKGKTIHGHLLERQGRRRFAKIIDTEERIWKVPESALRASRLRVRIGEPRRAAFTTRWSWPLCDTVVVTRVVGSSSPPRLGRRPDFVSTSAIRESNVGQICRLQGMARTAWSQEIDRRYVQLGRHTRTARRSNSPATAMCANYGSRVAAGRSGSSTRSTRDARRSS